MSEFNVSNRYAHALISMADDENILEQVNEDIALVHNTIKSSHDLRLMLASPIIREEKKSEILMDIFKQYTSDTSQKFIRFVVAKNREDLLFDITARFLDLMNEKFGRLELQVTSAVDMNDEQRKELVEKLAKSTRKKILPEYAIDESIIGGFKVRIKDTVIDASVEQQLRSLKDQLLKESVTVN